MKNDSSVCLRLCVFVCVCFWCVCAWRRQLLGHTFLSWVELTQSFRPFTTWAANQTSHNTWKARSPLINDWNPRKSITSTQTYYICVSPPYTLKPALKQQHLYSGALQPSSWSSTITHTHTQSQPWSDTPSPDEPDPICSNQIKSVQRAPGRASVLMITAVKGIQGLVACQGSPCFHTSGFNVSERGSDLKGSGCSKHWKVTRTHSAAWMSGSRVRKSL